MEAGWTDAEVIAASRDDGEVFAAIFDRHYDAIFRFAERRVGFEAANDVASDVFVTAFRVRASYDTEHPSALPWLYGIAARRVMHERRRFARSRNVVSRFVPEQPTTDDVSDGAARRVDASGDVIRLRAALAALEPETRELLLLVAWEGLSYADAARAMNVPIGTVRSRVSRARHALSVQLGVHAAATEEVS